MIKLTEQTKRAAKANLTMKSLVINPTVSFEKRNQVIDLLTSSLEDYVNLDGSLNYNLMLEDFSNFTK